MFAFFYLYSLEDLLCSEVPEQNTIEHCRLSQRERTQVHIEEATMVANIIIA
jgi:hypothetical protein